MGSQEKYDLMRSEAIRRIMRQPGIVFENTPPETFISAILKCIETWEQAREARHRPKGLIYHYCDANALLHILKTRRVWATSTKYLNDRTELLSLPAGMRGHANKFRTSKEGEVLADMVDFYWLTSDTAQTDTIGMDRFASCFSADGDLLSQWRAYGNDGKGYAIGFNAEHFAGLSGPEPLLDLRYMSYGNSQEAQLLNELFECFKPTLSKYLDVLDSTGSNDASARNWLSMRFGECLLSLPEEVKDASFAEEKEWRIYGGDSQDVKFRVSYDRIIPYKELDLSSKFSSLLLPIGEIVVGPRLDYAETNVSLTTYLSTLGYGTVTNILPSKAPYR